MLSIALMYGLLFSGCMGNKLKSKMPVEKQGLLEGTWKETWGCNNEETDVGYSDLYEINYENGLQVVCKDPHGNIRPTYRFDDVSFQNGHLSATLYNELDPNDVYIMQYELDLKAPDALYGQVSTNHDFQTSICWDRISRE